MTGPPSLSLTDALWPCPGLPAGLEGSSQVNPAQPRASGAPPVFAGNPEQPGPQQTDGQLRNVTSITNPVSASSFLPQNYRKSFASDPPCLQQRASNQCGQNHKKGLETAPLGLQVGLGEGGLGAAMVFRGCTPLLLKVSLLPGNGQQRSDRPKAEQSAGGSPSRKRPAHGKRCLYIG